MVRGITSAYGQRCNRTSSKSLGFFNQPFFVPKTTQPLETYSRSEQTKPFGDHQDLPPTRGVGYLNRFQGCLLPYTYTFHIQGRAYQFKALPFGLSTAPMEFTVIPKEVKLMAIHKDLRIHQYLDDWLVRARSHQACLQHTQELLKMCQQLGWLVNLEKSELEPKQDFDFVGYQFDLRSGRVRLTPDRWQNLQEKMLKLLSLPACLVREFMPLIGLLTGTEKQVHLGRLHMRPIRQIPPDLSPTYTGTSKKMCQQLGWLVNLEKSELEPKQDFDFVGYQFDLRSGRVRLTPDRWQNLQEKMLKLLSLPACLVWEFMSLIGLLTGTEKQVHLGRLHMRPILQIPPGLSPTYTGTSKNVSATGLAGELREIRAGAQTRL